MSDPYVYPGSDVPINTLGLKDHNKLAEIERQYAALRLANLPSFPLTEDGYKALHRHIFQDIYPWAGKTRTIDLAKVLPGGAQVAFLKGPYVGVGLRRFFSQLEKDNFLKGLDRKTFAFRAAVYVAELNYIHPFREGNGRAQRAFLKQLAAQAGHELDLTRITREEWIKASETSLAPAASGSIEERDYEDLTAVIEDALGGWRRSHKRGRGL